MEFIACERGAAIEYGARKTSLGANGLIFTLKQIA